METNLNQPSSDEGLEGLKKRLGSDAVREKIAALTEAFNYGQAGLDLVIEVLKDESSPIHSVAYLLLKERAEQQVKEALEEYYGEKIKDNEIYQDFLIEVYCELLTPLNGLIGFQKLLMEGMGDDPEKERNFLEKAHSFAMNLNRRLNDLQDLAKIEADKINLRLGEVKLDELFKDVENFARGLVQKKNLNLSLKIPTNHQKIILYGNYGRLLQVMSNLVNNAIRFTHEGEIKISAEVIEKLVIFQVGKFINMVKIEVADTGIGVSLHQLNNLFNPFYRRQHKYERQSYTGIGLLLSKRLVEKMGGEINFYSPGEGLGSTAEGVTRRLQSRLDKRHGTQTFLKIS